MRFGRRDDEDANSDELNEAGGVGWLKRATLAVVFIVILAVAGAGWFAYDQGIVQITDARIPLIKAEEGETKVLPDDPGGLQIPHQDKLVFERLAPDQSEPLVERLLPPPEIPIERPTVPELPAAASLAPPSDAPAPPPAPVQTAQTGGPGDGQDDPDVEEIDLVPPAPETVEITETAQSREPAESLLAETSGSRPAEVSAPPKRDDEIARVIENLTAEVPAPEAKPKSQPAPEPAPLQASLPASPKQPAPQAASTGGAGWRIQVASLSDPTTAEGEWVRLQERHADVLTGLSLKLQRADLDRGTFYRIQAGPLADRGSAEKVCDRLKSRSQGCLVVSP